MVQEIERPAKRIGGLRLGLAFAVAAAADSILLVSELNPILAWGVDFFVVFALFVLLGFRWVLVPVLVIEMIPGLALFPTWTLAVASLAMFGPRKR